MKNKQREWVITDNPHATICLVPRNHRFPGKRYGIFIVVLRRLCSLTMFSTLSGNDRNIATADYMTES